MASHASPSVDLTPVTPENLVTLKGSELVTLWKEKLGLDIWMEVGQAYLTLQKNSKVSAQDKFDAAVKLAELGMKTIKAGAENKKGGSVSVNIVAIDPTRR